MYAKDISRKVKSAKRLRLYKWYYISCQSPYGYKKDPKQTSLFYNNHLIVDEEIRPIIKLIYRLALECYGFPKLCLF